MNLSNIPRKKRLMVDIETCAVTPGAAVWEIGYYEIGNPSGYRGTFLLNPYNQGREIDNNTIDWLNINSTRWNEVKSEFHTLPYDTYTKLKSWVNETFEQAFDEIWCKGSDFDFTIIRSLLSNYDLPLPWSYQRQCCMRSFLNTFDEFKIDFGDGTQAHSALFDANVQAECLIKILTHVGKY